MQGEGQPFGYTGYRYDTLGATYFAQAREYDPQTGRFHAQDVIAGNGAVLVTLNRYGYCWGNPVGLVDLDGEEAIPWWMLVTTPDMRPAGKVIADEISDTVQNWIEKSNNVVAQVMRGDIGIELTDAELELMALHPDQAAIFLRDGYRATKLTEEKYGFTPEDGTLGNAYRHAMWNALLKQSFHSEKIAKMWTDAHEDYPEERLLNEEWKGHTRKEHCEMDLHNNAVGLDVVEWYEWWLSTDEISNRIMERINNGEMMVLVDDPRCDLEGE